MSMMRVCNCTILRGVSRALISAGMESSLSIDIDKLKADMTACVDRTSGRSFSLKATGGRNPDFFRNFMKHGRDKRISADVFMGIVQALERNPFDYVDGASASIALPSATVLTSTFAMLLESVGIDPFQDERAQKLAQRFPSALQRFSDLREQMIEDEGSGPSKDAPDPDEDQPAA